MSDRVTQEEKDAIAGEFGGEREQFENLLMDYFSIGVAQGKEGRDHDDEAASAQETHLRLVEAWKAARATAIPDTHRLVPLDALSGIMELAGVALVYQPFGTKDRQHFDTLLAAAKEKNDGL